MHTHTQGWLDHPWRIALATAAFFLTAMLGPCSTAGAAAEARIGVFLGLAIGLTFARGLRHALLDRDDAPDNPRMP